ncbi:MAG: 30S ribosomal protein S18 [bacterium]|nr:30S ribosomal protein S18 [bacterium]
MPSPQRNNNRKQQSRTPEPIIGCLYCKNHRLIIDYKDVTSLKRFTSSFSKILPRRKTSICDKHQRKVGEAIKRARFMALLPFIKE